MTNSFAPIADEPKVIAPLAKADASPKPRQKSLIMLLTIGSICGSFLAAILSIATLISLSKTKAEVMHSYVVDSTGNRLALHQITNPKEQAQHIQNFASWFVSGLHSYRWYIDGENGERIPDPGLSVGGGKKIPSAVYIATLAMRPELGIRYRQSMADVLSQKKVSAKEKSYFKLAADGISPPQAIGKDRWKIYVKGNQISVAESGEERLNARYVALVLAKVQPMSLSIAQKDYKDKDIANAAAETSAWGLEVQSIEDMASKYNPEPAKPTTKQQQVTNNGRQ
jgi:hypothetical protein